MTAIARNDGLRASALRTRYGESRRKMAQVSKQELEALRSGLTTIAVTGTNGKTTTTSMLAAIARKAGHSVALVTTLGMWVDDEQVARDGSFASFVRTLRRARAAGAKTLALEVTSRALAAGFAARWPADIAVFTNLTRDHLDRHGTPERYLAAKAQLFLQLAAGGTAVLNAADRASALLAEVTKPGVSLRRFQGAGGESCNADLAAEQVDSDETSSLARLHDSPLAIALGREISVGTGGTFNVDNALAAALAASAAGLDPDAIKAGLAQFGGVAGRFEVISRKPLCIVDFAHTPDALTRCLGQARQLAEARGGQLICVFGCGGQRDPEKREPMGEVVDRFAHVAWLTADNPRSEDPRDIADMVRKGFRGRSTLHEEPDRASAIAQAISAAAPADVVVLAGRGHEPTQRLLDTEVALSDAEVARAALGPSAT